MTKYLFVVLLALISVIPAAAADPAPEPDIQTAEAPAAETQSGDQNGISAEDLAQYLESMISVHRQIMSQDTSGISPREILLTESLRQTSTKAINYAFDFARAEAPVIEIKKPTIIYGPVMQAGKKQNLLKISAKVEQHIKDLQQGLEDLNGKIAASNAKDRPNLVAMRDKMTSELKLAKAQSDLLQNVLTISSSSSDEEVGLVRRISALARTVPEVSSEQQRKNAKTEANNLSATNVVAQQKPAANSGRGILALIGDLYSDFSRRSDIKDIINSNDSLQASSQNLLNALRTELKAEIKQGDQIANSAPAADGDNNLSEQKKQLDALLNQFKLSGTAVVPLNQAINWQDAVGRNLSEWDDLLKQGINDTLHTLALRLLVLAVAIIIPVLLSRLSQRTIVKYVKDGRRQRQLQTLRRILFGAIIGLIILLNLITESGSLLTFAGFLTAGLAVALQNVILSLVAHFFYFGRFGVREGDRVTVGSVTGEVIKIGMVRLYVMELAGKDFDFYPTGKIVAFPNSILFQPAAFTKLVPGTSFTWNEIRIILDPETDLDIANKKLLEAVDMVYQDYAERMQRQQEALQRSTHLNVSIAGPTGYVKFVDAGLAFVVRYPVAIGDSAEVHDRITRKLIDAIRAEPQLKLAS